MRANVTELIPKSSGTERNTVLGVIVTPSPGEKSVPILTDKRPSAVALAKRTSPI